MIRNLIGRVRAYEAAPVHPLQAVAGVIAIVVGLSVLRRYVAESGEELAGLVGETLAQTRRARELARTARETYPGPDDVDPLGNGNRQAVFREPTEDEIAAAQAELADELAADEAP